MDKSALVDKIKLLEGLTNDEKADLIGLLRSHKKYGLVWEEKAEDVEERLREQLPVLNEVKERAIVSDDADAPNHILIEGDNLEALTALSYSHEGKIDVIYIDPPYNTGNKDFVYNDSYVDSEDSYRHSKWLSFMHKRLKIAKRLLSEKGVIFISIDDNEQANLKLLCDEVFGEENCLSNAIRITTKRVKGDTVNVNIIHDYLLIYSKNKNYKINHKQKTDYSIYNLEDEFVEVRGRHLLRPLDNGSINYSSKSDYIIIAPDGSEIVAGGDKTKREERIKGKSKTKDWCFRWNKEKLEWGIKNGFIVFKKTGNTYRVYFKIYQFVDNNLQRTEKYDNLLSVIDNYYNNQGTTEVKSIFGNNALTYPKPISLLKEVLSVGGNNSSTILDFFAGSGTTLHATMQLNAEDGGNRQCILVTNNENKICEEVTYVRNKRVINGYTTPKGEHIEGLKRNTLRYYQTELLPREHSPKNMRELMSKATDLLCIKEDLYTEQPMFGRYKTHPKALRYFADAQKQMLILYREEFIPEIVEEIKGMDFGGKKLKIYLYSPGHYAFEDDFFEVQDKVELIALPSAIYKAYKEVLPKAKDKLIELANEETTEGGTL